MEANKIKVQQLINKLKPKNKIIATDIEITKILFAGDTIKDILEKAEKTSKDFLLWTARGKDSCLPISIFMDDVEIEEN